MKQLTQKELGRKYGDFARWYDIAVAPLEFFILRRVRRELLRHASGQILEVGVGTGRNLAYYPGDCELTGIEYSSAMLEKAREHARQLGRKIVLKQGDAQKLPFKTGSFDCVVDTLCLCTYPDPVRALREMKRVCKKGGTILLLEHGRSNHQFVERLQRWREEKHYRQLGCHLLREPLELARKAGLKIVEEKRVFFGIFSVVRAKV